MVSFKMYPRPENFTPSRMVWMVTFCKSAKRQCADSSGPSPLSALLSTLHSPLSTLHCNLYNVQYKLYRVYSYRLL